ncbi:MAG TPA: alkaline phosphatase family protein [Dongiaceae bacterium]|nr:alkaline phosphatase family protein [Dongiaceae bacterium]
MTATGSARAPGRRAGAALAALLVAAGLGAASVVRVPQGSLGLAGGRLLLSGWHLRLPLAPVRTIALEGRLNAIDADRVGADGATTRVRLTGGYRIEIERLGAGREALRAGGVEGLARAVLETHLGRMAPEAAALLTAPGGGTHPLPAAIADPLFEALATAGLAPVAASLTAGPPAAFVAAGNAAIDGGATPPTRDATGLRVVLIGLDGADWDLIDPLARAGRLPRLAGLLRDGVRAPLRSYDPMISPLLWTTMATGVGPDLHGIADFQAVEAKTGRRVPITSRFRKAPAIWEMLDAAGASSGFVAWWASYPAEPTRGFQVSNLVAFETLRPRAAGTAAPPDLTWPRDYLDAVAPRLGTAADLPFDEVRPILHVDRAAFEAARADVLHPPPAAPGGETRRAVQQPVALAISILTGTRNYAAIGADLAARHPDLTAVYFEGIDMMGHRFQHCLPPETPLCPPADFARFKDAVTGFYEYQDRRLGEVLDAAGPGTTVMVVSDHGFRSGSVRPPDILPYTNEQPVEWHDPEGIFLLAGPGARRGARLATRPTLFDIAPTLLYLLGLPADARMPGRVLQEAIEPAFVAAHPPRRIPDWQPATAARHEALGAAAEAGGGARGDAAAAAEAELLASLRALGYIGGDEGSSAGPTGAGARGAGAGAAGAAGPGDAPATAAPDASETLVFYHRNLATYFMKRREYPQAVDQLRLANQRQRLPKTYQMLSEALLLMGRRDEAEAALRASLDDLPASDPEPVLWLVRLGLAGSGGRGAAQATARRYAARTAARPGLDDAIAGLLLEEDGDAAGALTRYRASFAADPLRVVVAQRLFDLESPADRVARLLPALERAVARDPRLDEYHNLIGLLDAGSGRVDAAVAAFGRAVDLDPDNARFAANLGGACARGGRWSEAAEAYARALELQPAPATALKLGSAMRRAGRRDEALDAFARARDLGDDTGAAALGLATVQSELGRTGEAIATAEAALRARPGDAALERLLSDLRRRGGGPSSAQPPAERADRPAPGRAL